MSEGGRLPYVGQTGHDKMQICPFLECLTAISERSDLQGWCLSSLVPGLLPWRSGTSGVHRCLGVLQPFVLRALIRGNHGASCTKIIAMGRTPVHKTPKPEERCGDAAKQPPVPVTMEPWPCSAGRQSRVCGAATRKMKRALAQQTPAAASTKPPSPCQGPRYSRTRVPLLAVLSSPLRQSTLPHARHGYILPFRFYFLTHLHRRADKNAPNWRPK